MNMIMDQRKISHPVNLLLQLSLTFSIRRSVDHRGSSDQVTLFLLTLVAFLTQKWIISNSRESYFSGVIRWNGCTFITFYIRRRSKACKNGFFLKNYSLKGTGGMLKPLRLVWDWCLPRWKLDSEVRLYGKGKDLNKNVGSCASQVPSKSPLSLSPSSKYHNLKFRILHASTIFPDLCPTIFSVFLNHPSCKRFSYR